MQHINVKIFAEAKVLNVMFYFNINQVNMYAFYFYFNYFKKTTKLA